MVKNTPIKMPELLLYGRAVLFGLLLAECARIAFLGSVAFGNWTTSMLSPLVVVAVILFCLAVLYFYAKRRQAFVYLRRIVVSRRVDLLLSAALGVWGNFLVAPKLAKFHDAFGRQDMEWAPLVLVMFVLIFLVSLVRDFISRREEPSGQINFLADDEIENEKHDALAVSEQARVFAKTVLAAENQAGLVFGLDAPWGTGKTSFLNIAEREWEKSQSTVVVKFQTLRYASETDLSDRFIRELCTAIKQQAFAPEFAPAADRYSRMLKGKTDFSFLGFKLSLEPSNETIDELLEDINTVLKQSGKRLIVIVEDLDRLEPKLINNVLFTVRRTFKLSQANYILCYDSEMLVASKEEGGRARDFLEKFITVTMSLFVDGEVLKKFLKTDWRKDASRFPLIPADTMFNLSGIMNVVADMVSGKDSHHYAPLIGDLRKLKRLVNAMLLMRLDKFDFERSDFNQRDLVHLVLLHLRYPGIFRKIYREETEGRTGIFSLNRSSKDRQVAFRNHEAFGEFIKNLDEPALFLVKQLFDISVLGFSDYSQPDESVIRSRACFNSTSRNLENYLRLIVRFAAPADVETFKLYKNAVRDIVLGKKTIKEICTSDLFSLKRGQKVQDELWRVLINSSLEISSSQAVEIIDYLVDVLPTYSAIENDGRGLRERSIYNLGSLLNRLGYEVSRNGRISDRTNLRDIAVQIMGDRNSVSPSLIERVAAPERGALGWNDLMIFRLVCSIDRRGDLMNVYTGLLQLEDPSAKCTGEVTALAVDSMRRFSQTIFSLFKSRFIDSKVNFYLTVDEISDEDIFGAMVQPEGVGNGTESPEVVRSTIKAFVIYQLANKVSGTGSGVGCGYYDEKGRADRGGIHKAMARYLLDFCFDPTVQPDHAHVFGNFCAYVSRDANLSAHGDLTASTIEASFTKILPKGDLAGFWLKHRDNLRSALLGLDRQVVSHNFSARYKDVLPPVFSALDSMAGIEADACIAAREEHA